MEARLEDQLADLSQIYGDFLRREEKRFKAAKGFNKDIIGLRILAIRNRSTSLQGYRDLIDADIVNLDAQYDEYRRVLDLIAITRKELAVMLADEYHAGSHEQYAPFPYAVDYDKSSFFRLLATTKEQLENVFASLVEIFVCEDTYFPDRDKH